MKHLTIITILLSFSLLLAAEVSTKEVYSDEGLKLLIQREIPKPVIVEKEVIKTIEDTSKIEALNTELTKTKAEKQAIIDDYATLKIHTDEAKRIVDAKTNGRQWWDNAFFAFLAGIVVGNLR